MVQFANSLSLSHFWRIKQTSTDQFSAIGNLGTFRYLSVMSHTLIKYEFAALDKEMGNG